MSVDFKQIDDDQLEQLAAPPVRPLFDVFEHAEAMVPWVVLLACLPALIAVTYRPLTDENAAWALKALRLSSAPTVGEFLAPGTRDETLPHRWQPPLISWVAALAADAFGAWTPSAVMFASILLTAGFLLAAYALALRIADAKLGILTVCLLAFHVDVLAAAQSTSPVAAALCFAVLTIWAFLGHVHKSRTTLSADLLVGGIALGFCLLAGGMMAFVVVLLLALHGIGLKLPLQRSADLPPVPRGQNVTMGPRLRSLGVMSLTAFAVGGWWELMMGYSEGQPFWWAWMTGAEDYSVAIRPVSGDSAFILPHDLSEMMLVLAGPILYGIWRAIREIQVAENPRRCRDLQLLLVWAIVAAACWQTARSHHLTASTGQEMWQGFLLVPLLILGAGGILRILEGRAPGWVVALIGLTTAVNLIWHAPSHLARTGLITMLIMFALIGILSVIASFGGDARDAASHPRRESRLLSATFVLLLVAGHCLAGFRAVPRSGPAERDLKLLHRAMSKIEHPVTHFTIVSPDANQAAPLQLEYLARTTWPAARGQVYTSWDDVPNWADVGTDKKAEPISRQTPAHVYFLWQTPQIPFAAAGGRAEIMRFQEYYRQKQVSVLVRPAAAQ